ncbi:MAG: J domain-containing protein [Thermodesulfobacteriota bacterium]|nr:J domain-containing protein [Thermodesulfobacteriota bacterium]
MDIQKCFEILELDPDAGADEAKQAYKDLVNVWHPDRFAGNPRLRKKSEDRLKDINIAYETIRPVLSSQKTGGPAAGQQVKSGKEAETMTSPDPVSTTKNYGREEKTGTSGETEAFVEAGTGLLLNVFSSFYSAVRRIVKDVAAEMDMNNSDQQQNNAIGNKYRQKGMNRGKGRGMGNRGGGRGRGRR